MTPFHAVVAGAGIGGLTAALALARPDRSVTIVERRTDFAPEGAGIQISPNASRVLLRLGLGSALGRVAFEPGSMAVRDLRSGRSLGGVTLGREAAERFGAPYWLVARADLHTLLLDAVRDRPGIRLRTGRSVEGVARRPDGIDVALRTSGGETETLAADLLVGADGIGSRVRALAGDPRSPVASGFVAYRATVAALPAERAGGSLWLGPGRHVVAYPVSAGRALNIVAVLRGRVAGEGWSRPVEPDAVARPFADAAPDLRAILGRATAWSCWALHDLPVRRLASGRIALLGDAGHPALPFAAQGAAMAIEDAALLATRLDAGGTADVVGALAAYDRVRTPRVASIQRLARRNALAYHASGPVAVVRDLVMRRLGPAGMLARYGWIYGYDAVTA